MSEEMNKYYKQKGKNQINYKEEVTYEGVTSK